MNDNLYAIAQAPPLTAVSLATSPLSPQPANTPITLTATATGGANVRYPVLAVQRHRHPGVEPIARVFVLATCPWTPTVTGDYLLSATAQDVLTGAAVNKLLWYTIGNPLTAVSVTPSLASPQPPNTPITLTATATGGTNVQFQFWLYNHAAIPAWSQLQAYSTSATYKWIPATAGNYLISVTAQDAHRHGSQYATLVYHRQPVDGSEQSPRRSPHRNQPNTPITFTATATGGTQRAVSSSGSITRPPPRRGASCKPIRHRLPACGHRQ